MARVLASEVKDIITTSKTLTEVDPYINTANLVVTEHLADQEISTALLKEIELWLTAHFLSIDDPRTTRKRIGDAEEYYEGRYESGDGFKSTRFGRQAIALDPTGKLSNIGKKKVSFTAIDLGLDD